ncbi:MAG: PilZ domain-containing protein [Myxococcota bacterium]
MPKRVEEKQKPMLEAPGPKQAPPPPSFERDSFGGEEHRNFPRAKIAVRFELRIGDEPDLRFQATLMSENLSVSGVFLNSSFYLPLGTEVRVSFTLGEEEPVEARATIVREERLDRQGRGRSGFALRFTEFYSQTEVTLARLFLGQQLTQFAQTYLESKRAKSLRNEFDRVVDALAAWELMKVTSAGDLWGLQREKD